MKALITGGAGFVGSHLAEALLARGDEVFVLDNLSTGSIENIEALKREARFHYTIDSVTNEPVCAELIDRVDVVFHLAAAVGVRLIVESPVNTIETNVHGTEMVLKLANKKKKKVLVASTSEVYGKSESVPFREDARMREFARHGTVEYLGLGTALEAAGLRACVMALLADAPRRRTMSARGRALVDGLGASRAAEVVLASVGRA